MNQEPLKERFVLGLKFRQRKFKSWDKVKFTDFTVISITDSPSSRTKVILIEEYREIVRKKSKLSARNRNLIIEEFHKNWEQVSN